MPQHSIESEGLFHIPFLWWYQSLIFSDQVLLDIPYLDGVMFNIKFTYLKIADVAEDF